MPMPFDFSHGGDTLAMSGVSGIPQNDILDFSVNVRPGGPAQHVLLAAASGMAKIAEYPSPRAEEAKLAASRRFGLPTRQFAFGNGSAELMHALARMLAFENVPLAVIPAPSFSVYREACTLAGIESLTPACTLIERRSHREEKVWHPSLDWKLPEEELLSCPERSAIFLANPGNPAGTFLPPKKLLSYIRRRPDVFWIVDEAFIEYAGPNCSILPQLASLEGAKVAVLRSLTKFQGLAGLRLGFLAATGDIASKTEDFLPPWNVNCIALAAAQAVLSTDGEELEDERETRQKNCLARKDLLQRLAPLPLQACKSVANYLLLKLDRPRKDFALTMLQHEGIALRHCDNYQGLEDGSWYRVCVLDKERHDRLCLALERELAMQGPCQEGESEKERKQERGKAAGAAPYSGKQVKTPALMIQGASSGAGKSVLVAAFCRAFFEDGFSPAPFKAQNMSLNSGVTLDGKEMGRAQMLQAQACGLDADVRMNPVLLKPSSDMGSQLVLLGEAKSHIRAKDFLSAKQRLWRPVCQAYASLSREHDVMVLEGAGSPAEINLKKSDIVNMAMAKEAGAKVLVAGDIDRGGIYASFLGTWLSFSCEEKRLLKGWVVNRFRGDQSLLEPANLALAKATGAPVLGVVPWIADLGLPEEDSFFNAGELFKEARRSDFIDAALVILEHVSNCTDFAPLGMEDDVRLRPVRNAQELGDPDLILLPGSKSVAKDLNALLESGLAKKIREKARAGCRVFGICGGMQMLGERLLDPFGMESKEASIRGLGILPIETSLLATKTLRAKTSARNPSMEHEASGYEIHHGETRLTGAPSFLFETGQRRGDVTGLALGETWGTYLHGIFDGDGFRREFLNGLRKKKGLAPLGQTLCFDVESKLSRLVQILRRSVDMQAIYRMLGLK